MEKYQEWKWYDTLAIIVLFVGSMICLINKDYIIGLVCLLLILMILMAFKKEIYLKLAEKELNKGNLEKSREYCNKVLKDKPNHLYGLIKKGEIYEYQNKNDSALKVYEETIKKYPESYIIWQKKGELYDKLNNKSKADESYLTANKLKTAADEKKLINKIMKKLMFKK